MATHQRNCGPLKGFRGCFLRPRFDCLSRLVPTDGDAVFAHDHCTGGIQAIWPESRPRNVADDLVVEKHHMGSGVAKRADFDVHRGLQAIHV